MENQAETVPEQTAGVDAVVEDTPEQVKEVETEEVVKSPKPEAIDDVETVVANAVPAFDLKPVLIIIACAAVGLGMGLFFSLEDSRNYDTVISWVALPGDLFLRALRAIVLPLVFVNIILAVVDMINAGKASSVGWKTVALYTFTTMVAAVEGLVFILMFKSGFSQKDEPNNTPEPELKFQCNLGSSVAQFLQADEIGNLFCGDEESVNDTTFMLIDTNNALVNDAGPSVANDISFSQTLQDGIFRKLVPQNIVGEFVSGNFVGVLMFALLFGVASQSLNRQPHSVVKLLGEVNKVFLAMVNWIIALTPIAVLSLVAGNLGAQGNLADQFSDIGLLMGATILAMGCHFTFVYPGLFLFFVRENPFKYYQYLIPAQTLAFASASSAATLPVSLDCVASTGQVPASVRNFVLSMGATLNMDGGGIYFPTAIVFLAVSDGLDDKLDAAAYFLIVLLSTIGSAGTAPVPSASLVLIITAYNTVFDTTGTPQSFGLILAVDWLMDRFRTTLNVTGDMTMARIVTAVANVKPEDDVLFNEAVAGEDGLVVTSEASV